MLEIPDNNVVEGNREIVVQISTQDTAVNISVPEDQLEIVDNDGKLTFIQLHVYIDHKMNNLAVRCSVLSAMPPFFI